MNKHVLAFALVASTFGPAAMAQNYFFGAVGSSEVDFDCQGLSVCDTKGIAVKLGYGFDIGGWAVELGYADFGKAEIAFGTVSGTAKAAGPTLAAAWQAQLSDNWGLALRAGVGYLKTTISGTVVGVGSGSESEWNAAPYIGLGVNYALTKSTKLELGADFTKGEFDDEKADLRALTIGARFAF